MRYEPTFASVEQHPIPKWYDDAKFGIFIHWGLFSVPAWAKAEGKSLTDLGDSEEGFAASMKNQPYAEWYLNTSRIPGSATQKHHKEVYGENFSYYEFAKDFEKTSPQVDFNTWAEVFKKAGAQYVVLVTKHHDGYCLWPSAYKNPQMPDYQSRRDIVGDLTEAVRSHGMKMGLYYSGIFDWTFKQHPIDGFENWVDHHLCSDEYYAYSMNQTRELIERYHPSILWNDIGFPPQADLNALYASYYNEVPDGVINDRWRQYVLDPARSRQEQIDGWVKRLEGELEHGIAALLCTDGHYDYNTPEYATTTTYKEKKWEMTRGMSMSFAYNQMDDPAGILTFPEIVRMIVDVVSKNGNLLLNIGPKADGTLPEEQVRPLLEVGKWLETNGEAIYGTRCWKQQVGKTADGQEVRYTVKPDALYVSVFTQELPQSVQIQDLQIPENALVQLLGTGKYLNWTQEGADLKICVPADASQEPVMVFKVILA